MKQAKALLISKKMVALDVYHLYFYVEGEGLSFTPGEYIILTIPSSPTPLKRLYSFACSNTNKNIFELFIKLVPGGAASEYVRSLSVGALVDVAGPAGLFRQNETKNRKIYMVTGTGYAPVRSFLFSQKTKPLNSILFWGMRDFSDVCLFEELLALKEASPTFSFFYCLSKQNSFTGIPADLLHYFRSGHIDAVWSSQIPTIDPLDEYYLCGSRTVIDSLRTLLLARGVSKNNLFFEKY